MSVTLRTTLSGLNLPTLVTTFEKQKFFREIKNFGEGGLILWPIQVAKLVSRNLYAFHLIHKMKETRNTLEGFKWKD